MIILFILKTQPEDLLTIILQFTITNEIDEIALLRLINYYLEDSLRECTVYLPWKSRVRRNIMFILFFKYLINQHEIIIERMN